MTIREQSLKRSARTAVATFKTAEIPLGLDDQGHRIKAFKLDVQEVSRLQYSLCVKALNQCERPRGEPDYDPDAMTVFTSTLPVVNVGAFDAFAYCDWQGGRLPTAAEWLYAVRGTTDRTWPWGEVDPAPERINISLFNLDSADYFSKNLVPVQDPAYLMGTAPADKVIWHLMGNAREWVSTRAEDCTLNEKGTRNINVHLCDSWHGETDAWQLFGAGMSYTDSLVPEESDRVEEFLNFDISAHRSDLGFRCAYDP